MPEGEDTVLYHPPPEPPPELRGESDGFDIDSTMQMLKALAWTGEREDVRAVATDVFRDHLLNFKVDAAKQWEVEFWK